MPTSIGEMPASANGPVEFHPLTVNDQDHLCLRRGIHPPALIGFDVSPSYVNKDDLARTLRPYSSRCCKHSSCCRHWNFSTHQTSMPMIRRTLPAALVAIGALTAPALASENSGVCSQNPVVMVIDGVTNDRQQMAIYGQALKESGLHQHAGSYYLNDPRPLRILEGNRDQNHVTLLINFPSECAAIDFWSSPIYRQKIKPLRNNAGDYTIELYRLL